MLTLQLYLLIKGSGSMLIIDGTEGFHYCPLFRLDSRPETGHFLDDCVRLFNVLGLPNVLFFFMVLTIADVTALLSQIFLEVSRSISKTLASAALTEAMLEAHNRSICSDFSIIIY